MSERFEILCAHWYGAGHRCGCPLVTDDRDGALEKPWARCVGCGRRAKLSGQQWDKLRAADDAWYAEQEIAEHERQEQERFPDRLREVNRRLLDQQSERERAAAKLSAEHSLAQLDMLSTLGGAA